MRRLKGQGRIVNKDGGRHDCGDDGGGLHFESKLKAAMLERGEE